jgi:hypothetical protein
MVDAQTALGSLGSDLAFSVSFGIGRELMDAANEAGMTEDELVAAVLVLSIVFIALPRTVKLVLDELGRCCVRAKILSSEAKLTPTEHGLLAFVALLVDIARRIAISLSVQLLAANVRAKQPDRAVRIVSLLSVAVFFLFLEATSSIGIKVAGA